MAGSTTLTARCAARRSPKPSATWIARVRAEADRDGDLARLHLSALPAGPAARRCRPACDLRPGFHRFPRQRTAAGRTRRLVAPTCRSTGNRCAMWTTKGITSRWPIPALQDLYGRTYRDLVHDDGLSSSYAEFGDTPGRLWSVRNYVKHLAASGVACRPPATRVDLLRPVPQPGVRLHAGRRAVLSRHPASRSAETTRRPAASIAARTRHGNSGWRAIWPTGSTATPRPRISNCRSGRTSR